MWGILNIFFKFCCVSFFIMCNGEVNEKLNGESVYSPFNYSLEKSAFSEKLLFFLKQIFGVCITSFIVLLFQQLFAGIICHYFNSIH